MKILVGIDDSRSSGDVLRAMVTQFRPENTEVRVLHVLQPIAPAPPQMAAGYAPELEYQKQPAHALVERIAKELRTAGFKVDTVVEIGDIRESIIDSAAEWHADLIVVGSHGQTRHPTFPAGQRGGIRSPPRQVLRRNRSRTSPIKSFYTRKPRPHGAVNDLTKPERLGHCRGSHKIVTFCTFVITSAARDLLSAFATEQQILRAQAQVARNDTLK